MTPGLYVLTGETRFSGPEVVNAFGSTLYFVCGTPSAPRACASGGEVGGNVLFTGQSVLNYTAPTTTVNGGVPGLAIVADRNNTSEFSWRGLGATAVDRHDLHPQRHPQLPRQRQRACRSTRSSSSVT